MVWNKREDGRIFFVKTDLLLIAVVLFAAIFCYQFYGNFGEGGTVEAKIYLNSELVHTIDLQQGTEMSFSIPERTQVIFRVYEDGGIAFIQSDCPDRICVRTGKINISGQSAACLPNQIVVKIVSKDGENDVDVVTG